MTVVVTVVVVVVIVNSPLPPSFRPSALMMVSAVVDAGDSGTSEVASGSDFVSGVSLRLTKRQRRQDSKGYRAQSWIYTLISSYRGLIT